MAERIQYHLDEHIDPDIARALRRHGIDVTMIRRLILVYEVLGADEIRGRVEFL